MVPKFKKSISGKMAPPQSKRGSLHLHRIEVDRPGRMAEDDLGRAVSRSLLPLSRFGRRDRLATLDLKGRVPQAEEHFDVVRGVPSIFVPRDHFDFRIAYDPARFADLFVPNGVEEASIEEAAWRLPGRDGSTRQPPPPIRRPRRTPVRASPPAGRWRRWNRRR